MKLGVATMHRATALLAAVLLLAAGACLLDAGEHGTQDLCLVHAAVTAVSVPAFFLTPAGHPAPVAALASARLRPDFPSPPPRA
jgi:hypothetical protein